MSSMLNEAPSREPNFFIAGASRSGTTSMWHYLRQHPDIFMPGELEEWWEKEPSFFCDLTPFWAVKYRNIDAYLSLFDSAKLEKAIGEASANYLICPESPSRIRQQFPGAKIIIMLRNPVARAYSLYRFMCFMGGEWISPFEKALTEEDNRYNSKNFMVNNPFYYYGYLYFRSGLYSTQIQRFQSMFPKDQIHFVVFEEMKRNTLDTVQRVYEFLGVSRYFIPQIIKYNERRQVLSTRGQYLICRVLKSRFCNTHPLKDAVASSVRMASQINVMLGKMFPMRLNADTYEKLLERYEEDILKTAELTDLNLRSWLC